MFSTAGAYERFMGRWSRVLAPLVVNFAGVRDGDHVVDVGCGTGALAEALLAVAPSSHLIGIDRSEAYIVEARRRARSGTARFDVGDAQRLPLADASVDRALSVLALNFVPDPARAASEMVRVTRRGGTVCAAVWDYGRGMEMLRVFWDEAIALDPACGARDERHMPLCREGELGALWREVGLDDVVERPLVIDTGFASFDDFWSPFLDQQGPAGAYVAGLSGVDVSRLRDALQSRLAPRGGDVPLPLRARAWAVRGRKSAEIAATRAQVVSPPEPLESRDRDTYQTRGAMYCSSRRTRGPRG
jgi:SAM-dependent methyltransferase